MLLRMESKYIFFSNQAYFQLFGMPSRLPQRLGTIHDIMHKNTDAERLLQTNDGPPDIACFAVV